MIRYITLSVFLFACTNNLESVQQATNEVSSSDAGANCLIDPWATAVCNSKDHSYTAGFWCDSPVFELPDSRYSMYCLNYLGNFIRKDKSPTDPVNVEYGTPISLWCCYRTLPEN